MVVVEVVAAVCLSARKSDSGQGTMGRLLLLLRRKGGRFFLGTGWCRTGCECECEGERRPGGGCGCAKLRLRPPMFSFSFFFSCSIFFFFFARFRLTLL